MLAAAREAKGWSMAELARQAGLSVNTVSAVEREIRAPSLRVASALVVALGLRVWLHEPAKPVTAPEAAGTPPGPPARAARESARKKGGK